MVFGYRHILSERILPVALFASPWSSSEWTITMNIGREPGTFMPETWGASGARLVLPMEVLVESDYYSYPSDTGKRNEDYLGDRPFRISVLENPSYVNTSGQHVVPFQEIGAWKITFARRATTGGSVGDASKLRFWLDIDKSATTTDVAAQRNDVTLLFNERLYFIANCWRNDKEYDIGLRRYCEIEQEMKRRCQIVEDRLQHETGDRRLDGANIVDTVAASIDMALLLRQRDESIRTHGQAQQILPTTELSKMAIPGSWPGSDTQLIIGSGSVAIKRPRRIDGTDEYHIIGVFTAKPSDKWEIIDDDDENDNATEELQVG